MTRKIGKTYIKKEKKLSFLITLITLVVVGMVIAVIELLPGDVPELGYSEQNGLEGLLCIHLFLLMVMINSL